MKDPFREHHRTITAAIKAATRDLRLIEGVVVTMRRDKHGIAVETRHPQRCPCANCDGIK
jgi:hypothetical protein